MFKFELYDYFDVWGNESEGWEVNNISHDTFEDEEDILDACPAVIVKILKRVGYFNQSVSPDDIVIIGYGPDMVEIELPNGFPVCRIASV